MGPALDDDDDDDDEFFPRCMECQRGLAMRKLSVYLSSSWIVTKRNYSVKLKT